MFRVCLLALTCVCGLWGAALGAPNVPVVEPAPLSAPTSVRQLPLPIDLAKLWLSGQSNVNFDNTTLRVFEAVPLNTTLAQVQNQPDAFHEFDPSLTYDLSPSTALWLHFRVIEQPNLDAGMWSFELPKPFVDRVEFHYRDSKGNWQMQAAGDNIAQSEWPLRGLHPQFYLPNMTPGVNDFYIKVHQLLPLRFSVSLKTIEQATLDNQHMLLANALVCGLLVFVALLALLLALAYKSVAYAWYAGYVVFAFFAIASYVGIGHYVLWSSATWWSEISHGVCLKVALVVQLQFCRVMFVRPALTPWLNRLTQAGILVSLAGVFVPLAMPIAAIEVRMASTLLILLLTCVLMLLIVGRAAYQKSVIAWLWVLAYVPMVSLLALTFAEQYAFISMPWLPYNAIIFAVAFEVLVLMVALHLHAKSKHAINVRKMTLIELDPLTGFVAPLYYPDTLARLWSEARQRREDLVVVYVHADNHADVVINDDLATEFQAEAQSLTSDELMLRRVRMLRIVTRPKDTVACVSPSVFAILMPNTSLGPNVINKLSRLKALGLMTDTDDMPAQPVKFKMTVTSFESFSGTSSQLDNALKKQLLQFNAASDRSIEFIRNK